MESVAFIFYLAVIMIIGLIAFFKTRNLSDYILGGRKVGSTVTALSANASDMSGWLLLGLPGFAYVAGLEAAWIALGLGIGTWLNWEFVARPLRVNTEKYNNSLTIPEYFENFFDDKTHLLRIVSAVSIIIFFTLYTSSGLVAAAKLFNIAFGIPYMTSLLLGVLSIVVYTMLGGYLAVSWTDAIQSMMMLFALLAIPLMIAFTMDGPLSGIADGLNAKNENLLDMFTKSDGSALSWTAIISLMGWGLGYFGQPHILSRFMGIESPDKIGRAKAISISWVVLSLGAAVLVGILGVTHLNVPLVGKDTELVFMGLVKQMFHPLIAGALLSAALAAIMSTADSQILIVSSSLAEDIYKMFKGKCSQVELLIVGRLGVVLVAAAALLIALKSDSKILDLVAYAWAGFGASFGPLIILSLHWPLITRNGAMLGVISGGATVILWKQFEGGIFSLYEIVPGFLISTAFIIVASLLERKLAAN